MARLTPRGRKAGRPQGLVLNIAAIRDTTTLPSVDKFAHPLRSESTSVSPSTGFSIASPRSQWPDNTYARDASKASTESTLSPLQNDSKAAYQGTDWQRQDFDKTSVPVSNAKAPHLTKILKIEMDKIHSPMENKPKAPGQDLDKTSISPRERKTRNLPLLPVQTSFEDCLSPPDSPHWMRNNGVDATEYSVILCSLLSSKYTGSPLDYSSQMARGVSAPTRQQAEPRSARYESGKQAEPRSPKEKNIRLKEHARRQGNTDPIALAEILKVDEYDAVLMLQRAQTGEHVSLESMSSRKEAMTLEQQLRDKGFSVRITSRTAQASSAQQHAAMVTGFRRLSSDNTEPGRELAAQHNIADRMVEKRRASCGAFDGSEGMIQSHVKNGWFSESVQHGDQRDVPLLKALTVTRPRPGDEANKLRYLVKRHKDTIKGTAKSSGKIVLAGSGIKIACELARTFVYGGVVDYALANRIEEEGLLRAGMKEVIGTRSMVQKLHGVWVDIDRDCGGSATCDEFHEYLKRRKQSALSDEELEFLEDLLMEGQQSFAVERLMHLIWPAAGYEQTATMKSWFIEFDQEMNRSTMKAPPVLGKADREALQKVFTEYDIDESGTVSFEELLVMGVVHDYQRQEFMAKWDRDGNGELDTDEFCEFLCPRGFRAHDHSTTGTMSDGTRVYMNVTSGQWVVELKIIEEPDDFACRRMCTH